MVLRVDSRELTTHLAKLNRFGRTDEGGISRICLMPAEVKARKYIIELMEKSSLKVTIDQVANVIGILGTKNRGKDAVLTGSHIDSVVNGGTLDGNLGVLAGVESARSLGEANAKYSKPLGVVCFTNEEGVRFPPTIGSKYFSGLQDLREIYQMTDAQGTTFREALRIAELSIDAEFSLRNSVNFDSFVELHIEQGPVLEENKIDIGVVESIVGILQYEVHIEGSADHAGTTPMKSRKDALIAAANIALRVNEITGTIGQGVVGTVGVMKVMPGAPNVVPGKVNLVIDIRHSSKRVLDSFAREIKDSAMLIARHTRTRIRLHRRAYLKPSLMSNRIMNVIEESAEELDLSFCKIHSGAGHDTMIISQICDCGMIFVPSEGGKSHSPIEHTKSKDIVNGANVLLNTLHKLIS